MTVIRIHPEAPPKPALGAACNGCGLCCLLEPCPLGQLISRRRRGACDALRWDAPGNRYRCGALSDTAGLLGPRWRVWAPLLQPLARRWIAAGAGCDAALERLDAPPQHGTVAMALDVGPPASPTSPASPAALARADGPPKPP